MKFLFRFALQSKIQLADAINWVKDLRYKSNILLGMMFEILTFSVFLSFRPSVQKTGLHLI